MAEVSVQALQ